MKHLYSPVHTQEYRPLNRPDAESDHSLFFSCDFLYFFFTLPVILDLLLKWNCRFHQKLCFFLFPCGGLSGGKFPAHDLSYKCCAHVKTEPVRKRDGVWCCFLENRSARQKMLSQTRSHFTPHLLRPSALHTPSVKYIP